MTESVALLISAVLNFALLSACLVLFVRSRKFRRPFDPRVVLYVNRRDKVGWVTDTGYRLSPRASDAVPMRLSEARKRANAMVDAGFYVRVARIVHQEHWREGYVRRKNREGGENG